MFDKPYAGSPGAARGRLVVTDGAGVAPEPLLGDPACACTTLIPDAPDLDLAVNLMTFDPGAALPFTETHVMEHGLLVLEGCLVYRLGDVVVPGQGGRRDLDGAVLPPVVLRATGPRRRVPVYKDWNRDPLRERADDARRR